MARTKKRKYPKGVTFRIEAEEDQIPVRGNAMASGDDDEDKKYEDEIIDRLERGDVWAWAAVTVIAEYEGFKGWDHLGGCSYKDERDFVKNSGYYEDMKSEAYDDLLSKMSAAGATLQKFKKSGGSLAKVNAEVRKALRR